jgi:hypothetical protein
MSDTLDEVTELRLVEAVGWIRCVFVQDCVVLSK